MLLFLLRHAEAVDDAPSDAARELTAHGHEQARAVGAWCHRHRLTPELVLSSPYRRTLQTAELVAGAVDTLTQTAPFLASGMKPDAALHELRDYQRLASVLVVGHQPDLGLLAASLLGLEDAGTLPFEKATLACLRIAHFAPGGASLEFLLPARLMF